MVATQFVLIGQFSPWIWCVLGVVAVALYLILRPRYDFTIAVKNRIVEFHGRIPKNRSAAIREFFRRDMPLDAPVKILGRRVEGGRLELQIRGYLDTWDRQRIRNFLLAEM